MKLLKLHIENFRSLRNVAWEPGDLNVLIGPNAGGKSNLIRAIQLLSSAASGNPGDNIVRQGGLASLAWGGTERFIGFNVTTVGKATPSGEEEVRYTYTFGITREDYPSNYFVAPEFLERTTGGLGIQLIERYPGSASLKDGTGREVRALALSELDREETLLSAAVHPMTGLQDLRELERFFSRLATYQEFRTDSRAAVRRAEISRREPIVSADGSNLVSVLHTLYSDNSTFESDINDAMFAAFGDEFVKLVFSPNAADQRIQFKVRWKSLDNPVPASDLSDGTLRYLYLLAILANPNPPPLIAIDEPETGLHPRMMTFIAEFAAEAARRTQVVFTTHSAAFLDALTRFNPTVTVVEANNSETQIKNVSPEVLAHWLQDYLLGELFRSRTLEAMA
ncbi:MAG TPA: AAA family ATPase [Pirellulales bacterium]|nr:AAA family ATPase [Pirellulales bacterium]